MGLRGFMDLGMKNTRATFPLSFFFSFLVVGSTSELARGKKALFTEDFGADIYEWGVTEEGETEEETPKLVRCNGAYQGNNLLLFSGKQGIIALSLIRKIQGIVSRAS